MATNFKESTHFTHWFFREDEQAIHAIRQRTVDRVRNEIHAHVQKMRSQTTTTSNGGDENGNDVVADVANVADIDIPCLSVEEEYLTLQNNMEIMGQLCDRLEFSRQTEATAMIYFKRFFLYHSIMQFDPRIFMLTCMFLALKTEEIHMKLDTFLYKVEQSTESKIEKKQIQKTELILLQGIKFHLVVYHPYRSLDSFLSDFFEEDRKHEGTTLLHNARKFIAESYKTDIPFLYPPGTIALAALYHFNPVDTSHFIEKNYASVPEIDTEHLMRSIKRIDSIVSSLAEADRTAKLKSARATLRKVKKMIEQYKVFDTTELERLQQESDRKRREAKLIATAHRNRIEEQEFLLDVKRK